MPKDKTETPSSNEPDTASNSEPRWKVVDQIPPSTRGGGYERNTEVKEFYAWLTSQPVGTKAIYREGANSAGLGDKVKERFPKMKVSSRQTGTAKRPNREGVETEYGVFTLYGEHVEPAAKTAPEGTDKEANEGSIV